MNMVADDRSMKSVDAITRQAVIAQAGVDILDKMEVGTDQEGAHAEADNILLEALYARGEYDLVRAYKEARERVGFWYA